MQSWSKLSVALVLAGTLLIPVAARASAPLPARDGESVRVVVNQRSRAAVALRPRAGAWRLSLAVGATSAEIVDVTPGTPARTLTLAVDGGELVFDDARFAGGHVYQVRLRLPRDRHDAIGFVYLHPAPVAPSRARGPQHMSFGDEPTEAPTPPPSSDDAIAPVPKSL